MKRCNKCGTEKPIEEFSKYKKSKDGRQAYCKVCSAKLFREWRSSNRERYRALCRKFYKAHPERKRTYWLRNREKHPEAYLWTAAKGRARRDGTYFSITVEDIKIPQICPVLGIPLSFGAKATEDRSNSPSLDRIDSKLGYVPGNVIVMSHKANTIKSNATLAELDAVIAWLKTQSELNPPKRPAGLT